MLDIIIITMILVMAIILIITTPQVVIHYHLLDHRKPLLGIQQLMPIIKKMVMPVLSSLVELTTLPHHFHSDIKTIPRDGQMVLPARIIPLTVVIIVLTAVITVLTGGIIT
jgi:hypothetical protein